MKQYPRFLYKSKDVALKVSNEAEEIKAGLEGYENHWNKEVNEKQKGTDKEVLRPVEEVVTQEKIEEGKEDNQPVKRTRKGK